MHCIALRKAAAIHGTDAGEQSIRFLASAGGCLIVRIGKQKMVLRRPQCGNARNVSERSRGLGIDLGEKLSLPREACIASRRASERGREGGGRETLIPGDARGRERERGREKERKGREREREGCSEEILHRTRLQLSVRSSGCGKRLSKRRRQLGASVGDTIPSPAPSPMRSF